MMTLDEAIAHEEKIADFRHEAYLFYKNKSGEFYQSEARILKERENEHRQYAEWFRELRARRKECDYWLEKAHSYEQTIHKLTDAISKQPGIARCGECEHFRQEPDGEMWCGVSKGHGIDKDFFCGDAERRTDADD